MKKINYEKDDNSSNGMSRNEGKIGRIQGVRNIKIRKKLMEEWSKDLCKS